MDLFFSDPIYKDVDQYHNLAELAAAKLKPGRLCLAYSGLKYLPDVIGVMGEHLVYWWTFAVRFSGQHTAIHPRHIQNKWKPIVAFCKPPVQVAPDWMVDLLEGGGREKDRHDYEQPETEAEYLIRKLTEPDDLVVDGFCGSGTIPVAAKSLGRRWLATEIDPATARLARKRLADMGIRRRGA